ncbi:MAG: alternative ribosome rescue aminoacyl-tRNA hydrolase ArfB [Rhodospirillales bacterium]
MIRITEEIAIDERDLVETFIHAPGPGGQNVNKLTTAVQLRFDAANASLPETVRARLVRLAGRRLTQEGVLVITAHRHRSRERNREDALARLIELMRRAAVPARPRKPTRPTPASRRRRLEAKLRRSALKRGRTTFVTSED